MSVNVAIVGSGFIAVRDYYPAFKRDDIREKMTVTAICDVVPGRAKEHCERFGFGTPYTDFDTMLKEAPIDVVAILSPIPYHFETAKKALLAGKHTYVQKTMTTTAAEAIELNRIAKEKGCILCASPGQMIETSHIQAKKMIDEGVLGKVCFARGQGGHVGHENEELFGIDPSWYYKQGGGPMMDVAVYPITSITGLLGPAKRVTAFSGVAKPDRYWMDKKLEVEVDDNTALILDFGDGVLATIQGNFCTRKCKTPQIELYGTKGTMLMGGWCDASNPLEVYTEDTILGSRAGWYKPVPPRGGKPKPSMVWTVADLMHVVDCVITGEKPIISGEHCAHVIEIIEKAYESARTGKAVDLTTTF